MNIAELETKSKDELIELAKEAGIADYAGLKKSDIIRRLLQAQTEQEGYIFCSGILEIMSDGYGFLRQDTLLPGQSDVYISPSQIRRFGLRNGDMVVGQGRPPKSNEKDFSLLQVAAINVSSLNVLLEFAPETAGRPTYVGLGTTSVAPAAFAAPLLAGVLVDTVGFPPVFGAAALFGAVGLGLLATRVRDPRHQPEAVTE